MNISINFGKLSVMGVIQKQALRSTIINFIGIGFGAVTRLIMPFVLEKTQIGILALLDSISGLFIVGLNFGYNLILKKMFPNYRDDENGHSGFLALGIILSLAGTLIGVTIFYSFDTLIFKGDVDKESLLRPFLFLIPILIFFRLLFVNLDGYVRMLFKTVVGIFLEGLVSKIILFIGITLLIFTLIDFDYFVYIYCLALSFPGLFILLYSFFITKKITLPTIELMAEHKVIKSYILFGILSSGSYAIIQYVDILMIKQLTTSNAEAEVGVYSVFFFASMLIMVPAKAITRISAIILAESWKDKDLDNIQDVYEKSALNLLIVGGFLFVVGWSCIDSVLEFEALQSYAYGKYAFLFLGIGRLVELSTGVNQEIIDSSKKYKYNTYFSIALAVLAIGFNFFLIPKYGIIGAAFATLLALLIINIIRAIFLYKVYKLIPFKSNFFKVLVIVISFIVFASVLKFNINPIVQILINVILITVLFWGIVVKLKLSVDINNWIAKMQRRFFKKG